MIEFKNDKAVSVCFSGHRNIPLLYRKRLKQLLIKEITKAYADGYRLFYHGAALGFDQLAAEAAISLKAELPDLQVIAVVPYRGQAERWSDAMKAGYEAVLAVRMK